MSGNGDPPLRSISAVTFATHDMAVAVAFYRALGFELKYGGEQAAFTSFHCGEGFVNLVLTPRDKTWSWWGRVIFHVDDVDRMFERALAAGYRTETAPRNAEWGERYFHITDPDGHELSFAKPLDESCDGL